MKLKLIILEQPYYCLDSSFVRDIYSKILDMKIRRYRQDYVDGVNPIGVDDLFSTHFVLCEEKGKEFFPILALKYVMNKDCKKFHSHFVISEITKSLPDVNYVINKEIDDNSAYVSSLAVSPDYQHNPRALVHSKSFICMAILKYLERAKPSNLFVLAATRNSSYRLIESLGFIPLTDDLLEVPSYDDELVYIEKYVDMTKPARIKASSIESLWISRIDINNSQRIDKMSLHETSI